MPWAPRAAVGSWRFSLWDSAPSGVFTGWGFSLTMSVYSRSAGVNLAQRIRATGITAYLLNWAQSTMRRASAAHESHQTTKRHDRTPYAITLDEVESIAI